LKEDGGSTKNQAGNLRFGEAQSRVKKKKSEAEKLLDSSLNNSKRWLKKSGVSDLANLEGGKTRYKRPPALDRPREALPQMNDGERKKGADAARATKETTAFPVV